MMIRITLLVLLALVPLAVAPATSPAQESLPVTATQQTPQEPAFTAAPATQGATGLPRSGVDRTMRGYWHLFIAFAITWLLLFGYAISLGRRFGALERKLERQG